MADTPAGGSPPSGPDDLLAGYTGPHNASSKPSKSGPGANKPIRNIVLWTLASIGGLLLMVGVATALLKASMSASTDAVASSAVDKQVAELRDKVIFFCGSAMDAYMRYDGDGAAIINGDDLMGQCDRYTLELSSAAAGTSWAGCASAGKTYRKVATTSRDTGLYAHGLLKAGAHAEWERTMREWGAMLKTELGPLREACKLPDDYDAFAKKP